MVRNTYTREEAELLENIERARRANIRIGGECEALYCAILNSLDSTGNVAVTEDRLIRAHDRLYERAVEQGKEGKMRWLGQIG
jgi:hypothetical protein